MGRLRNSSQDSQTSAPAPVAPPEPVVEPVRAHGISAPFEERPGRRSRAGSILAALFGLNFFVVLGQFASHTNAHSWGRLHGVITAFGQLSGLIGADLILVQLLLIARAPMLDRMVGADRLLRWHKLLGKITFVAVVMHVGFIITGYADGVGILHATSNLVFKTRDILMAVVSFCLICMIVATSIHAARKRLKYETWYFIHLYTYLAIALAIPHQIFVGRDFVGHLGTQLYWASLYMGVASTLVYFRLLVPLLRTLRHDLRVSKIVRENHCTVSVYITGRHLMAIPVQPGQHMNFRFLTKQSWHESHPYSLSAAPNTEYLRITVKEVGDGTSSLAKLAKGTRVIVEGPFGKFTNAVRTQRKVVLIAGGIGITPLRALAEAIPADKGDITLIYRLHTEADAVFNRELRDLAAQRGINLQHLIGPRGAFLPDSPPLGSRRLLVLAPHIADSDVFVCGPSAMMEYVRDSLRVLGLQDSQIHYEEFGY